MDKIEMKYVGKYYECKYCKCSLEKDDKCYMGYVCHSCMHDFEDYEAG